MAVCCGGGGHERQEKWGARVVGARYGWGQQVHPVLMVKSIGPRLRVGMEQLSLVMVVGVV